MPAWVLVLSLFSPAAGDGPVPAEDEVGYAGRQVDQAGAQLLALGAGGRRGVLRMQNGDFVGALEIFESVLDGEPDNRRLHMLIGEALLSMNECDEGRDRVLSHRTRPAFRLQLPRMLAACYARHGDYSEAVYWQEEAALVDSRSALVWALLGLYRYRQGDYWGADEALREAASIDPNEMRLSYAYASMALTEGDHSEIDILITRLRNSELGYAPSWVLEARLELDLGNPVLADRAAQQAVRKNWRAATGLELRAEALRRHGDGDGAELLLERGRDLYSQRPTLWAVQARVWVDARNLAEAEELLEHALEQSPYDPELMASAWYLARARGDADEMELWAQRYEAAQVNHLRTLSALVPLTESQK